MSNPTNKQSMKLPGEILAVIYARISKDRPDEQSIANQLREIREYCALMGWKVVSEFHDRGKSAYKLDTDREGFDSAMAMVESGQANKLVVWKLDRMTRNARGFRQIHERLETASETFGYRVTFASKSEPWFDTSTSIGLVIVMLMVALAEMEAENAQLRVESWHRGRNGNLMPPVGNRPYGYDRPKANKLIENESESVIIKDVAARIIKGDSLGSIQRYLTETQVPTPMAVAGWSINSIRNIVSNPTVAAMVEVDGDYVRSERWEPILDQPTWTLVRENLKQSRSNGGTTTNKLKYLLSSMMMCAKCDGRMITHIHSLGRRYKCEGCGNSVHGEIADAKVTTWVLENTTQNDWQSMLTQGKGTNPRVIADIEQRIDEFVMNQAVTKSAKVRESLGKGIAVLEAELAAAMTEPAVDIPDVPNLHKAWPTMNVKDQRRVIKARCESIKVHPHATGCTGADRIKVS